MPYANESPAALRQKHQSRVPVVCRGESGQTLRLLVPKGMDGDGFKDAVSKHRNFPAGLLCVGGRPLRKADDFGTLDKMYGNPQGCLHVVCHSRPAVPEAADSSSVQAAAGSEARSEDSPPAAAASSETPTCQSPASAQLQPPSQRKRRAPTPEAAKKLLRKYPTRVPVICAQAAAAGGAAAADLPRGVRKMLAPREMLCGELRDVICRQLAAYRDGLVAPGQADLFVKGTRLEPGGKVADAFDRHMAEDGLLYVSLSPLAALSPADRQSLAADDPGSEQQVARAGAEDLDTSTLVQRLSEAGPPVTGNKAELVARPQGPAVVRLQGQAGAAGGAEATGTTRGPNVAVLKAEREAFDTRRARTAAEDSGRALQTRMKAAAEAEAELVTEEARRDESPADEAALSEEEEEKEEAQESEQGTEAPLREPGAQPEQFFIGDGDSAGEQPGDGPDDAHRAEAGEEGGAAGAERMNVSLAGERSGGEEETAEGRAQAVEQPGDGPNDAQPAEAREEEGTGAERRRVRPGRAERLAHQAEERAQAAERRAQAAARREQAAERRAQAAERRAHAREAERLLGAAEKRAQAAEQAAREEGLRRAEAEAEAARAGREAAQERGMRQEAEKGRAEEAERAMRERDEAERRAQAACELHALELQREAGKLHDAGERAQEAELARERASQRLSEAEEELLQLRRALAQREKALAQREEAARQCQERSVVLEQRELALERREATLAQRKGALEQRERALERREVVVAAGAWRRGSPLGVPPPYFATPAPPPGPPPGAWGSTPAGSPAVGGLAWPAPSADSWAHLFGALSAGPPRPLGPPAGSRADKTETAAAFAAAAAAAPPPGGRPAPPPKAPTQQTASPGWAAQDEQHVGDALEQLRLDAVLAGAVRQHGLEPELAHASRAATSQGNPFASAGGGRAQVQQDAGAAEPDDLADWLQVQDSDHDLASLLADPPAPPGSCTSSSSSSNSNSSSDSSSGGGGGSGSTCRTSEAAGSDRSDDWLVVEEFEDALGDQGELAAGI